MSCWPTRASFRSRRSTRFCRRDSILGGHPEAGKVPGVEASTGALGHGLSIGVGMALAARMQKRDSRVIVVMGDGEINEGSVWEAALCAGKHRLVQPHRRHRLQQDPVGRPDARDPGSRAAARQVARLQFRRRRGRRSRRRGACASVFDRLPLAADRPSAIICHTVKGKGIAFAENDANWHHKSKIANDVVAKLYARPGVTHAPDLSQHGLRSRQARRARAVHRLRSQSRACSAT